MIALILQSFNRTIIVGDYYVNKGVYAENCENKARPALECNGKCQMVKKLQQEDEKDKQNPARKIENNKEILLYVEKVTPFQLTIPHLEERVYGLTPIPGTMDRPDDIFHPPAA